jgi:DNA/RNA endonuclease G (NUC1)
MGGYRQEPASTPKTFRCIPGETKLDLRPMRRLTSIFICLLLVTLRANAIIDATLQMQLGNPSNATSDSNNHDHYLIQRTVEAIDYSDNLGESVWASWDLTTSDIGGSGRNSTFYTDSTLPVDFYHVSTDDYNGVGTNNFNRGHLCPSADRTDTTNDNKLVFYMSNIMPQSALNNQGVWGNFEDYCRSMLTTNELLIICGGSGFGTNTIPSGKAFIPSNTWKVVVCVPLGNGTALSRLTISNRVIAISIPNVTNGLSSTWQTYVTSAHQIELDTGFTFFTAAPSLMASVYRARIDGTPAPSITTVSPVSGATGDSITINGTNLSTASSVVFNGANANFTVNSDSQVTATVPFGASSGTISVITAGGLATSAINFTDTSLPVLNIVASGTNTILISWPAPATGFALQQNLDLTTAGWSSVTNAVNSVGGLNQIVLPLMSGNSFFRLVNQ